MNTPPPRGESGHGLALEWIVAPPPSGGSAVVATGVFDILHVAHARFLTWAAGRGRPLYVGVEADDRVRAAKGHSRPVNPLADRAEILAALKPVAAVFAIVGDPAVRDRRHYIDLLAAISPAAIAFSAGDPHRPDKVAAAGALGCEAWEFPHQDGYSTSTLIARIAVDEPR